MKFKDAFASSRKQKGQFFILGAVIISSLFFLGIPRFSSVIEQPSNDIPYVSSNIRHELPYALNLGLNSSDAAGTLANFTHYMEGKLMERNLNYTSVWLMFQNTSTDSKNITGGNYLGHDITLTVNFSTGAGTNIKDFIIPNGTINYTTLLAEGAYYNITLAFLDQEETAEFPAFKTNFFAFYLLTREDDVIKNFVWA